MAFMDSRMPPAALRGSMAVTEDQSMRNILINTWAVTGIAGSVVAVSAIASVTTGNTEWFGRAGSIATVLGLLLLVKHSVLCAGYDLEDAMAEKLHYRRDRPPPTLGSPRYLADLRHTRRILFDEFLGFGVTLVGTLIWGYGDLLLGFVL